METIITIDDGDKLDCLTAELLDSFDLKGLFFIPTNHTLSFDEIVKISKRHEIGGHTVTHRTLTTISNESIEFEVLSNIRYLEILTDKEITKFAYPKGWYDDRVIDIIKNKCRIDKAYTMKLGIVDQCYNNLSLPRTFHVRPRPEYEENGIVLSAKKLYRLAENRRNGYFNVCLHSWEVEKYRLWDDLKQILEFIKENENKSSRIK